MGTPMTGMEPMGSPSELFESQHLRSQKLRESTAGERIAKLQRLRRVVIAYRDQLIEAGRLDFNKPAVEVEMTEIMPVVGEIGHTCKHLRRWLKPKRIPTTSMMLGTRASVRYEPRGRCLIIAPWNYPLTLTFGPLVPAIASGNTVIIKTSELTPNFSRVMVRIIREAFDPAEVAIVEGDAKLATDLLALPFDHTFFTGSPAIGKLVMEAASRHLTSVTLELGGKSPTIVDESADLELAARTIAWGKFINAGQTCIAPDHLYVHASVKDRLVALFRERIAEYYGKGEQAKAAPFARIVNQRHTRRVAGLIQDAQRRGAQILVGGDIDESANFISPTLLGSIPQDASIMSEEIFGPVLPVIEFSRIEEVIDRVNAGPKPLAMYIWTEKSDVAQTIIARTSAGATCINHVGVHFLHGNLPFGGVNNSGIGSYHGEWGIRAFSHERAILKTRFMLARVFMPPYTERTQKIVRWITRIL